MSIENDRRIIGLVDRAWQLPAEEITTFLDRECADDVTLRQQVEQLLRAIHQSEGMISTAPIPVDPQPSRQAVARGIPPGTVLSKRYKIVDRIGSGGMGDVYEATDSELERSVAIKTLNTAHADDRKMQERFTRELKTVATLLDPNIVTLFDVSTHDNVRFAVMELVDGRTLRELIDDGMQPGDAVDLGRQIALGLQAAHDRELMHRDIKPENIIVTPGGTAKILDFGIARREAIPVDQQLTVSSVTPGTVPYMSPEQAEGKELTCATDIFSLGTVIYEMLAGHNPFRGETPLSTLRAITAPDPPALSECVSVVSDEVEAIVRDMLQLSPSTRPSASQVAQRLEAHLNTNSDQQQRATTASHAKSKTSVVANASTVVPAHERKAWQPSLAVLPFQVLGGADDLEATADHLVSHLTTVLTRVPLLAMTSRMSSMSVKGQNLTPKQIHERLGVDYFLEGTLQHLGDQVCANVQLVSTKSGFHLWAQPFERSSGEVDGLLRDILVRLEPQLSRAIFNDLGDSSGELTSRQLLVRATSLLSIKGWHRDSFSEVADLLRRSISLEPDFALTHANLALILGLGQRVGLTTDASYAEEAIRHADKAIDLDELDSNVLGLAGCALSDVGQTGRAIPILKNAIEINPLNAQAYAALGTTYMVIAKHRQAVDQITRGIELSPADGRLAVWYAILALAYLHLGESTLALEAAEKGCQSDRKTYLPRVVQTAVHLFRDEESEAIDLLGESLRVKPDLSNDEVVYLVGREFGIAIRKLRRRL